MDKDSFYSASSGEQIGYRYIALKEIETGVFGRVIKCVDMKTGSEVALKLSKSDKSEAHYALLESKMLKKIQI